MDGAAFLAMMKTKVFLAIQAKHIIVPRGASLFKWMGQSVGGASQALPPLRI